MGTVDTSLREKFEEDALPHIEALWSTALWLTIGRNEADRLVLDTMTHAYRTWGVPVSTVSSKVRLFRILTRRFFDTVAGRHQPGGFLDENNDLVATTDQGGRHQPMTSTDRRELIKLRGASDAAFRNAIKRLRVQSRLIAILLFRERFSYSDIAYITDLRYDSVKAILGRLRKIIPRFLLRPHVCLVTAIDGFTAARALKASSDGE
jgi:RNA polymerase sigma-70 factor (ECF subfamily)